MRSTTELRQHRPKEPQGVSRKAALWPLGRCNVKAGCGKSVKATSFPAMPKADEEREKRLAEALRENLRRRKAQARGEDAAPAAADRAKD